MKRALAALALAILVCLSGLPSRANQARDLPDPGDLGCHRITYTPPGWPQPIGVTVCP